MQLPAAFRSLSRPSSAPSAKASTLRSSSLNRIRLRLLVNTNLRKNHLFRFLLPQQKYLVNCVLLFFDIFSSILSFKKILFFHYAVVNEHGHQTKVDGRLKWARTTDLALIRRAL